MTITVTTREHFILLSNKHSRTQPEIRTALCGPSLQGTTTGLTGLPARCSGTSLEAAILGLMEWGGGVVGGGGSHSCGGHRKVSHDCFPLGSREVGVTLLCL